MEGVVTRPNPEATQELHYVWTIEGLSYCMDYLGYMERRDHRVIVNAILWRLATDAPWRDLSAGFSS